MLDVPCCRSLIHSYGFLRRCEYVSNNFPGSVADKTYVCEAVGSHFVESGISVEMSLRRVAVACLTKSSVCVPRPKRVRPGRKTALYPTAVSAARNGLAQISDPDVREEVAAAPLFVGCSYSIRHFGIDAQLSQGFTAW